MAIVEPSRVEEGCLNYDFHQSIDDESIFVWHETWANQAAIERHGVSEHFKEFSEAVKDITDEHLQLTFTRMISKKA